MKSARFWEGFFAAAVLASALFVSSCGSASGNGTASSDASSDQTIEATQQDSQESDSSSPSDVASGKSEEAFHAFQASSNTGIPDGWDEWSEDAAPNYLYEVGAAVVRHDADAGEYRYSDLDSLGRTQEAYAVITHQDRSHAEKRGRTHMDSSIKPSGWGHNDRFGISLPNGKTYHGYLWNRSHLIADSLGGAMRVENMITGTRTQNVGANDGEGGMGYCETIARDWLDRHADGALYYAAMPLYVGDEPVARAVLVDMKSSDGTIDSEYIVYNAAKGCVIDYATGEASTQTDESASTAAAGERRWSERSRSRCRGRRLRRSYRLYHQIRQTLPRFTRLSGFEQREQDHRSKAERGRIEGQNALQNRILDAKPLPVRKAATLLAIGSDER